MPEGDTIYKIAAYLRPRLEGQVLSQVAVARTPLPLLCRLTVLQVRSVGKHLLLHCGPPESGWVLRVHLGLHGSWHRYAHGEHWRRPRWQATLTVATTTDVYACFDAADVACLRAEELAQHPPLRALGPDLLAADCDLNVVLARVAAQPPDTPLADVLLNQSLAAGIGNIYKSEVLFICRQHPLTPLAAVATATRQALYVTARQQLQANLGGWSRITTYDRRLGPARPPAGPGLWVYGRRAQGCLRCTAQIRRAELGRHRRVTYWCPECQPTCGGAAMPGPAS